MNSEDKYENGRDSFIKDGKVYIFSQFNEKISKLLPELNTLIYQVKDLKDPEIEFIINSPGGYATELFGLLSYIDVAKSLGIKIITRVIGMAASCASLLAVVGDERYMHKYSFNLMHYGYSGTGLCQNPEEMLRYANYTNMHFENIVDVYARHTTLKRDKIRSLMKSDNLYLDPKTCKEYGLCDEIF